MISKFINTGSFALIIICFLLPFLSIKCNDMKLVEFKGYDLIIGKDYSIKNPANKTFSEDVDKDKSEQTNEIGGEEKKKLETNWFMVILLVSALSGIVFSLTKIGKKRIPLIISAGVGLFALIIMVALLGNKLESESGVGNLMLGLEIRLGYEIGFWLMLLILNGIILYNCILIVLDSKKPIPPSSPLNDYTPPSSIDEIV